jgi:CheY-like chemotaxis protein
MALVRGRPADTDNDMVLQINDRFGNFVRLVALTATAEPTLAADARAAGFDSVIAKPPTLEEFQKALLLQKA